MSESTSEKQLENLTRFAADLSFAEIPPEVVEHMKLLLIDTFACALGGTGRTEVQTLQKAIKGAGASGPSQAWGTADRFSPYDAAMVNATAVHAFELDDIAIGQHYGAAVIPAFLAAAGIKQQSLLTCADLVTGMVAANEVSSRIQRAIGRYPHATVGFHGPSVIATFGAAVAAGRALGLEPSGILTALGHAAQLTSGLMATQHGGMGKRLLAGASAGHGVFGAILADQGFTSTPSLLGDVYGSFFSAFSGAQQTFDLMVLDQNLGSDWASLETRFKRWACRVPIHPAIEALQDASSQYDLSTVQKVIVKLDDASLKAVGFPWKASSTASAQMNLQYCLASYLLDGEVFLDQFTPAYANRPELLEMIQRIHPVAAGSDSKLFSRSSEVEIQFADGTSTVVTGHVRGAHGEEGLEERVLKKARRLAEYAGHSDSMERIIALCESPLQQVNVRELLEILDVAD